MSWSDQSYLIGVSMAWIICTLFLMLADKLTLIEFLEFNSGFLFGMDIALLFKYKGLLK